MGRSKSRRAGALLTDEQISSGIKNVEDKLNAVQISLNNLKEQLNNNAEGPAMEPEGPAMEPEGPVMEPEGPIKEEIPKPWQNNTELKFKDGAGGRVTLSFPRIMMHLNKNIDENNNKKPWKEIKMKLLDATSTGEVQNLINEYGLNLKANYISGGTRKKRRGGKRRRTSKKY